VRSGSFAVSGVILRRVVVGAVDEAVGARSVSCQSLLCHPASPPIIHCSLSPHCSLFIVPLPFVVCYPPVSCRHSTCDPPQQAVARGARGGWCVVRCRGWALMLSWFRGVFCQRGSVCVVSYRKIKKKKKKYPRPKRRCHLLGPSWCWSFVLRHLPRGACRGGIGWGAVIVHEMCCLEGRHYNMFRT
jgi:hypothetical protein